MPDAFIDNTGGYIVLAHNTTVPASYVNGAAIVQGSTYSATIESVVTVDNKYRILVKNSTGNFSTSTNVAVGKEAGFCNTTGSCNVFLGSSACGSAADAVNQIVIGYNAMGANTNNNTITFNNPPNFNLYLYLSLALSE